MASSIDATKPVEGSATTASVRANFATAAAEISALQITGNEWIDPVTAAYASTTTFTVAGDYTSTFYPNSKPGKRIKCTGGADVYAFVLSATYAAPNTTVTVQSDVTLNANMDTVYLSIQNIDSTYAINKRFYELLSIETAANIYNFDYPWNHIFRYIPKAYLAGILDRTGVTDLSTYLQTALDSGLVEDYPAGTYYHTTGLTITTNGIKVKGQKRPSQGTNTDTGTIFRYSGTGTAWLVGVSPGVNGTYIYDIQMEDIRIEVDDSTTAALRIWHPHGSTFKKITIFGNNHADTGTRYGLRLQGGIDCVFEQIDVNGVGQTPGADTTQYLKYGLSAELGYSNAPITTTRFRDCYFHYCNIAAQHYSVTIFENCIFEASYYGTYAGSNSFTTFLDCWWESNVTLDTYFAGGNYTYITNGRMVGYTRQDFMSPGGGMVEFIAKNVLFSSSHATPRLFGSTSGNNLFSTTSGDVQLHNCRLPANCTIGGIYNNSTTNDVNIKSMRTQTLRFTASGVGVSYGAFLNADNGLAFYNAQQKGHIIGLRLWASSAVTAGTYTITTQIAGVSSTYFNISGASSTPYEIRKWPIVEPVAKDDAIKVYLSTSAAFAPTSNDIIIELLLELGESGVGL